MPASARRVGDESGLAGHRLDQVDLGVGEGHGEDQAGEAGSGADVGDPAGLTQLGDLEAGQAVGDVDLPGAVVGDRADRGALLGEQREDDLQRPALGRAEGSRRVGGLTTVDERRDDHAAVGLVALAVGLDPGAAFQPFVDDAALLGAHRVHLDDPIVGQRLLGGAIGAALERLAAPVAVARGVDDHAFAVAQAAESGLVAEQLQGIDRLAPFADQEAVVLLADDGHDDPIVVLLDLHVAVEVELIEHSLDQLAGALGGGLGPVGEVRHAPNLSDPRLDGQPVSRDRPSRLVGRWAPSTRSRIRRAASGRRPRPSISPPARPPKASRR